MENNSFQLTFLILLSQLLYFICINHHFVSSAKNLTGPSSRLSSWIDQQDCCQWFGTNFQKKHELRGVINLSLLELQQFKNIDLSMNKFGGIKVLEFIGRLKELRYLNLSAAYFTGSVSSFLGNLSNLQVLDLGGLDLSKATNYWVQIINDHIPSLLELYLPRCKLLKLPSSSQSLNLSSFLVLDLSDNAFNSTIPWTLEFIFNDLTGNILDALRKLWKLRDLQFRYNSLTGTILETIGNLSSLETFYLTSNKMSGNLTTNVGQLMSLFSLDILENMWEVIVKESHLLNISNLQQFSVGMKLGTNITLAFNISLNWNPSFNLTFLTIYIIFNTVRISDVVQDWFVELDLKLDNLDMDYNNLTGKVPNKFQLKFQASMDLSTNRSEGPRPLRSFNVTTLYLRDNLFSGPIVIHPVFLRYLEQNFEELALPNIADSDISRNNQNGTISLCMGDMNRLTTLALNNNQLIGQIDMSENCLSSQIPDSLGSLAYLILRNCTKMINNDLSNNQLSGLIPAWLRETIRLLLSLVLSGLHILNLSRNNLSGSIMSCFGNLEGFEVELIDITNSHNLGTLNLSGNHLRGNIPTDIGKLRWVEALDLSINQLPGLIPPSIATLDFLSHLSLSYNKVTGKIPTSSRFQTKVDPTIFQGNIALCSPPLKECVGDGTTTTSQSGRNGEGETNDEDKLEKVWFFTVVGLGYMVGFWAFFGTLIFKKRWRFAYCRFIEMCILLFMD
ncbi:hypothetical protein R3W88_016488 [Solanum pinnatisectum]|uniref:Uncharacterized protein n=1 Tax=Solanum pinnatisectum TaxID=50273 RepID=A0AAV9KXH9_9SOLN|nr:hypothetical protein R3W88_016488 [Solanum pinnatisectum]